MDKLNQEEELEEELKKVQQLKRKSGIQTAELSTIITGGAGNGNQSKFISITDIDDKKPLRTDLNTIRRTEKKLEKIDKLDIHDPFFSRK
jgi:hypothetical protein